MTRLALALAAAVCTAASLAAQAAPDLKAVETFDAAWKIIRDSHFDPGMNGLDWTAVRAELGPRAATAQTPSQLRAVISEMLGSVEGVDWGTLFAASTVQLVPIVVFVLAAQRYLMAGLSAGAVKG